MRTQDARPGLTRDEARARLVRHGLNRLPMDRRAPVLLALLRQVTHFFALMLWLAAVLALIADMPELFVGICLVIVVNGAFAFIQEYRADRAAARIRELLPRRATVRRDGVLVEIEASELVPGDVVLLRPGDRVSADLHIVDAHDLELDTSLLTGESAPVPVREAETAHAGSFVVRGAGEAIVQATGAATRLAGIARLSRARRRPHSPLARELNRVVHVVAAIAVATGTLFFAVALLVGMPASHGLLFAIGVTVALVPEGLLPTVTLSLAVGAQRMARERALVRRLESVQTLGSTTFICTDKTGTLTENHMAVVAVWTREGQASISGHGYSPEGTVTAQPEMMPGLRELARVAARCSDGAAVLENGVWVVRGDPMEAALDVLARRLGVDVLADIERARPGRTFAFDTSRKRMSLVAGDQLLLKGAPDTTLSRCRPCAGAAEAVEDMAARGLRVLAVAVRNAGDLPQGATADTAERDLRLLGLIGLQDPPRADVPTAIAACRRAGIRIAMITGDHPATALAIARQIGLPRGREFVVEGGDLPDDDAMLGALMDRDGIVVSRVTPEDKLRIARALQERGHVVAMTGDGVNDAPALRQADIGIAMGRSGTDVAREASDLVLLDDRFTTIVAAIVQGRATFINVRRFLTYHLTDNVAELAPFLIWALSGGHIPLALGVMQVLSLDIGTDLLPALALGAEPADAGLLERPPERRHLIERDLLVRSLLVLGPAEAAVELTAFLTVLYVAGFRPGQTFTPEAALASASGAAFLSVVIGQMANALACRSASHPFWTVRLWNNPLLLLAIAFELALAVCFLFIPPVARLLGHAPPSLEGFAVACLAAPSVWLADTLHKRWLQRRAPDQP
ncbi:MAG TPA: cation-transporting P-type ATPase [Polyangiaceae bacterium]